MADWGPSQEPHNGRCCQVEPPSITWQHQAQLAIMCERLRAVRIRTPCGAHARPACSCRDAHAQHAACAPLAAGGSPPRASAQALALAVGCIVPEHTHMEMRVHMARIVSKACESCGEHQHVLDKPPHTDAYAQRAHSHTFACAWKCSTPAAACQSMLAMRAHAGTGAGQ